MKTCIYSRFSPAERATPPNLNPDSLVHITIKQLLQALNKAERKPFDQEFGDSQPGIRQYLRFATPVRSPRGNENALAYHVAVLIWAVLTSRFHNVPAIRLQALRAGELRARRLFGNSSTLKQVNKLPVIRFAQSFLEHAKTHPGARFIVDDQSVLVKVLTVFLCFDAALKNP